MNSINKTLYIPLYGKAYVSKKGLFLTDKKAEEIWAAEGFPLKGKAKSKYLAYYMGIRSAVFDNWLKQKMEDHPEAVILHIGCGMDSRIERVSGDNRLWFDIDFPQVIEERKRYFTETQTYRMLPADVREHAWLEGIPQTQSAIVVMEGVSMYLAPEELRALTEKLCVHFAEVAFLMDCYTLMAAKLSKHRNPVKDVGVTEVYGMDDPKALQGDNFSFVNEHSMTPEHYTEKLKGFEKHLFKKLYAGNFSKKLYRLYEYKKA